MILIFCEHSTENNLPGSARTIWSGKGCCIDMMISLQENPTLAIGPMAKPRLCIKLLICDLLRSELCVPYSNRPRYRTRIRSARNFSIHHCALRSDTPRNIILASSGLSERCPKIGDVPKSPFHTVAALVPSVGIITLQIELHSDACAISTAPPPTPAYCLWCASGQRKATALHVASI